MKRTLRKISGAELLQRIEHYEIAAYGTMAELANALEETEIAELLGKTLAEEKAQDEKLTEVARSAIMPLALEEERGEEDQSEEEEDEESRETRKPAKSGSSGRTAAASRS